jgi:phytoene synthase
MQLTNICRDVAEDALMNRRYLPSSLIGDIEPAALINPDEQTQDKIRSTLITMLNNADVHYQSGHNGLCFLPNRARFGIVIASGLYRHIGTHLANNNYAFWAFRSVVSKPVKAWLTVKILIQSLLDKSFYFYTKAHNQRLHDAINEVAHLNG